MLNDELRKLLQAYPAKAIKFLYDKHYRTLVRFAFRFTKDIELAEDVVQETFVHLWENHKKLGEYHERPIHYYMARVVKNKAVSEYRRLAVARGSNISYAEENHSDQRESPLETQIIRNEKNEQLRRLIETFPRREKECLFMRMDDELNVAQIAVALSVSKKAVERSITSGNNRLRKFWLGK
jgi:RNA polymerase sigma factor (sigma-70 family)